MPDRSHPVIEVPVARFAVSDPFLRMATSGVPPAARRTGPHAMKGQSGIGTRHEAICGAGNLLAPFGIDARFLAPRANCNRPN